MTCSRPGNSGTRGQPPVAIRTRSAVTVRPLSIWIVWRSCNRAKPVNDFDAGAFEQISVDAVEPFDFARLVVAQRRPVEARRVDGPSVRRGVLEVFREVRSVHEQLLRYATDVDTRAAEIAPLHYGDARAVARRHPACANAAGSGADDEQIVVPLGHDVTPQQRSGEPNRSTSQCKDACPRWESRCAAVHCRDIAGSHT